MAKVPRNANQERKPETAVRKPQDATEQSVYDFFRRPPRSIFNSSKHGFFRTLFYTILTLPLDAVILSCIATLLSFLMWLVFRVPGVSLRHEGQITPLQFEMGIAVGALTLAAYFFWARPRLFLFLFRAVRSISDALRRRET